MPIGDIRVWCLWNAERADDEVRVEGENMLG